MSREVDSLDRERLQRGTTLLELIVAGAISLFVVILITTFVTRVINSRVKEESKINANEDVRRMEAVIKKAAGKQVAGTLTRIEADLTPCLRAGRLNASVTGCFNVAQFPSAKCPAGQRPTVKFTETNSISGAVIMTWTVPFPANQGKTVTNPNNSGASICVTEEGDHLAINLEQVVLEQGGDGGKPSVFRRSLVLPRSVITGYQIQ